MRSTATTRRTTSTRNPILRRLRRSRSSLTACMASLSHSNKRTRRAPRAGPTTSIDQEDGDGPGNTEVGGVTMTVELADRPSDVAVIRADPAPTGVTTPEESTTATDGLLLDHATLRPDNGLSLASSTVAESCVGWPTRLFTRLTFTSDRKSVV